MSSDDVNKTLPNRRWGSRYPGGVGSGADPSSIAWAAGPGALDPDQVPVRIRASADPSLDTVEIMPGPRLKIVGDFAELWEARRDGDKLPARADFDVEDMRPWLGYVLIMDVGVNAEDFRYRLIGTDATTFRGRDYTGKWISECDFGESRESIIATFRNPVLRRAPVFRSGMVHWPVDDTWRSFDSVHCPLASDGITPDMTIGVVYFDAVDVSAMGV